MRPAMAPPRRLLPAFSLPSDPVSAAGVASAPSAAELRSAGSEVELGPLFDEEAVDVRFSWKTPPWMVTNRPSSLSLEEVGPSDEDDGDEDDDSDGGLVVEDSGSELEVVG